MKDNKMVIKPNYSKLARYTEEEKIRLFAEGGVRAMYNVQKSKKTYQRNDKHKGKDLEY